MLRLYQHFFDELNLDGLEYCVWKNKNELQDALAGKGDIDLYVTSEARNEFLRILAKHGFIRVISPNRYPYVEHYYGFDETSGRLCHLHCYFRLVTGESHIKQFVLPIDDYIRQLPNEKNEFGVMEMNQALQQRLNCFRRKIKVSCLPGLYLFLKERAGYHQEKQLLQGSDDDRTLSVLSTGWIAGVQVSNSAIGEFLSGLVYRSKFRHFSRYSYLEAVYHRYKSIASRAVGKILKRKKTLRSGVVVMLLGPAAETGPASQRLMEWLEEDFSVKRLVLPTGIEMRDRSLFLTNAARATARGYIILLENAASPASSPDSGYFSADLVVKLPEGVGQCGSGVQAGGIIEVEDIHHRLKTLIWPMLRKTQCGNVSSQCE